ncbi:MAG: dihydrofolate reductase [Burkholderiaceae bacterium]|nr:MAG: dihydrofolate reductase [Burkholderiaceae bacterium]
MTFKIAIIAALAPNKSIGHADSLPWKMPRDMKFFRRSTADHVVVMGRNTFESLGCRPLPRRVNVVLTRTKSYSAKGLLVARSIDEAIDIARQHTKKERMFIIGGGSIYNQTETIADELYLTQIQKNDPKQKPLFDEEFYGDTFFPKLNRERWELCHISRRYKALDTLKPRPDPGSVNYYFRFFKFGRKSTCGCTDIEKAQVSKMKSLGEKIIYPI